MSSVYNRCLSRALHWKRSGLAYSLDSDLYWSGRQKKRQPGTTAGTCMQSHAISRKAVFCNRIRQRARLKSLSNRSNQRISNCPLQSGESGLGTYQHRPHWMARRQTVKWELWMSQKPSHHLGCSCCCWKKTGWQARRKNYGHTSASVLSVLDYNQ